MLSALTRINSARGVRNPHIGSWEDRQVANTDCSGRSTAWSCNVLLHTSGPGECYRVTVWQRNSAGCPLKTQMSLGTVIKPVQCNGVYFIHSFKYSIWTVYSNLPSALQEIKHIEVRSIDSTNTLGSIFVLWHVETHTLCNTYICGHMHVEVIANNIPIT